MGCLPFVVSASWGLLHCRICRHLFTEVLWTWCCFCIIYLIVPHLIVFATDLFGKASWYCRLHLLLYASELRSNLLGLVSWRMMYLCSICRSCLLLYFLAWYNSIRRFLSVNITFSSRLTNCGFSFLLSLRVRSFSCWLFRISDVFMVSCLHALRVSGSFAFFVLAACPKPLGKLFCKDLPAYLFTVYCTL